MRPFVIPGCAAAAALMLLMSGCHHRSPVRAPLPPLPPMNAGPVMVSVPPPSHRSSAAPDEITTGNIPVVQPVRPPRKTTKRSPVAPVPAAAVAAPPPVAPPTTPPPVKTQSLGQLTTGTDDPATARDQASQVLRAQHDRIMAVPPPVQASHPAEMEQARRFLRSASDSWNASDYGAAIALATKTRVLLDDLLK